MRYAIFCYQSEAETCALSKDKDDAMMAELQAVKANLGKGARIGPTARLMPTTAAMTVREGREIAVLDGPFAETKEQLLGFYVVDCETLEDAIEAARRLAAPRAAVGLTGALEIRPMRYFDMGSL
ncbi:MAG TPA: YciI family protein [Steroidobacteraceae bacterium]|nr:YciI family protein [Steroidobacteraceae bacterium]